MDKLIEKLKRMNPTYDYPGFAVSGVQLEKLIPSINRSRRSANVLIEVEHDWYVPNAPNDPTPRHPSSLIRYCLPEHQAAMKKTILEATNAHIRHIRIWDKDGNQWDLLP